MTEFALIPENETFFTSAGDLASGYQLFIYEAGSSTKATTHRDSDGLVANTNPIVLDSLGQTPYGVYVPTGTYKTVFTTDTDTDPPATAIRTRDNITPRNDATAATQSEWVVGPTPTYTSGTTFTLVGDQTSTFHVGRRLKLVDSGGTSYAVISVTAYTSLTTVTVVNDATAIDSGLSAVSYALFDANNLSMPHWSSATTGQHLGSDGTIPVWKSGADELVDTFEASGDSECVVYHDGLDVNGTVDFIDGWQYWLWFSLYGSAATAAPYMKLYEGSSYREASGDYSAQVNRTRSGVDAPADYLDTFGQFAGGGWGSTTLSKLTGTSTFSELVKTDARSNWLSVTGGNDGTSFAVQVAYGSTSGSDSELAAKHLKIYPSSGTMTGIIKLYRRKVP